MSDHTAPADPAAAVPLIHQGFAHHQAGALDQAAACYRAALALDPANLNGLQLLALIDLAAGRADQAALGLERAIAAVEARPPVPPSHAVLYNNLGDALRACGRRAEALARYRQGLALDPTVPQLHANIGIELLAAEQPAQAIPFFEAALTLAPDDADVRLNLACAQGAVGRSQEGLANLGLYVAVRPDDARALVARARIAQGMGQLSSAEADCRAALARDPGSTDALLTLAMVLTDAGRPKEAEEACRALLARDPANANAHTTLGAALAAQGDLNAAAAAHQACLALVPGHAAALYRMGDVMVKGGQPLLAVGYFAKVLENFPDYTNAHVEMGNALLQAGLPDQARESFRNALALRPITTWPVNAPDAPQPARPFSLLVLMAPGAFNTPARFLLGKCAYERHFYGVMPGVEPDLALLRRHGDAVYNLISDVDQGREVLEMAERLVDALGKPVINHPRQIANTGRDTGLALLRGIPDLRVPGTRRLTPADLADPHVLAGIAFPTLIRTAGTHGGDDFELVADAGEMAAFIQAHPASDYYVIEYVEYRSPDGHYRKYRFLWVGGEMLPYHLAIGNHWKVHHFRTDMDKTPWMQAEEADFLDHPERHFTPAHFQALHAIAQTLGLAYLGIDCGIDTQGRLLVFEANATILIHDDNAAYPYKTPHVARIKRAFDAMMETVALGAPSH